MTNVAFPWQDPAAWSVLEKESGRMLRSQQAALAARNLRTLLNTYLDPGQIVATVRNSESRNGDVQKVVVSWAVREACPEQVERMRSIVALFQWWNGAPPAFREFGRASVVSLVERQPTPADERRWAKRIRQQLAATLPTARAPRGPRL